MADLKQLERALRKADAAGNTEDARRLAVEVRKKRQQQSISPMMREERAQATEALNRKAEAEMGGSRSSALGGIMNVFQGVPFAGEYADEALGYVTGKIGQATGREDLTPERATEIMRSRRESFAEENPKTATGLQLGGAALGTVGALAGGAGGAALRYAPSSLGGQALYGAGLGTVGGATEGAVSGYGAGEGVEDRTSSAGRRAVLGAGLGGALGGAVPLVAGGTGALTRRILQHRANRSAAAQGLTPEATRVLAESLQGDDLARGLRNVRAAGPDAMPADAGPTVRGLLDTSIQGSGQGGRIAREAVEGRAGEAQRRVVQALDDRLGAPQGARATARNISRSTQPARSNAYEAAYNAPIDYASDAGRKIEDVLSRVPKKALRNAIDEANEEMVSRGLRNQQIMADIADDGGVTFREMPNVRQLDELKQSLERLADTDEFGRITKQGLRPQRLAGELRDAITEAVPEYRTALAAGGDKIAQDQGLRIGQRLLRSRTTREEIAEAVEGASEAKLTAMRQGARQHIEDTMANVQRTITDPNVDAREAMKAVKDLSGRASREKLKMILPDDEAEALFREIDSATQALELRAGVADNSKTFARQAMDRKARELTQGGPFATLQRGEPVNAAQRITQALTGRTPEAEQALRETMYADIARALTEPRGRAAEQMLRTLDQYAKQQPINDEIARALARRAGGGFALGGYQLGSQQTRN